MDHDDANIGWSAQLFEFKGNYCFLSNLMLSARSKWFTDILNIPINTPHTECTCFYFIGFIAGKIHKQLNLCLRFVYSKITISKHAA